MPSTYRIVQAISSQLCHLDSCILLHCFADLNQLKTFLIREPGDANPREVAVSKELTSPAGQSALHVIDRLHVLFS